MKSDKGVIKEIVTEEKVLQAIADTMKNARDSAGMTMREASELSGCSQVTIVKAETTGMVTAKVMAKLLAIYNYNPF